MTRPSTDPEYTKLMSKKTYCKRMMKKYESSEGLDDAKYKHYSNLYEETGRQLDEIRNSLGVKQFKKTTQEISESV